MTIKVIAAVAVVYHRRSDDDTIYYARRRAQVLARNESYRAQLISHSC